MKKRIRKKLYNYSLWYFFNLSDYKPRHYLRKNSRSVKVVLLNYLKNKNLTVKEVSTEG